MTNKTSQTNRNKTQKNNKALTTMTNQIWISQNFNPEYKLSNNNKKWKQLKSNIAHNKYKQACCSTNYKSFFHNLKKENKPTNSTSRKNINNRMDWLKITFKLLKSIRNSLIALFNKGIKKSKASFKSIKRTKYFQMKTNLLTSTRNSSSLHLTSKKGKVIRLIYSARLQ